MITELMENGIVTLAFLAAIGGGITWLFRKVVSPIHHKISRILEVVDYELTPNGGGSLIDKVNWLTTNNKEVAHQAEGIAKKLEDHQNAVNHRLEKIEAAILRKDQ